MFRRMLNGFLIVVLMFSLSGCGVLSAAVAAGISYGIYQATRK